MDRTISKKVFASSCKVIPGGVNSPVRSFPNLEVDPLIVSHGKGALITDVDGNEFIDYCCSWGASIFGHADDKINDAVIKQLKKGTSFGISMEIEKELAKLVVDLIPSIEKIRFVSSGTEATMTALRVARGYTDKPFIVKFTGNYHGHSDSLLMKAGSGMTQLSVSKGVLPETIKHTLSLPFNDVDAIEALFRDPIYSQLIAAVIVEPVAGNMGVVPATPHFLETIRKLTKKNGSLLIFDEVITGFRVGRKGASEFYGIDPDIITYGKIIGGGFPVAAIAGKQEIMDCLAPLGQVYQAGTLSGNPVAMQAGYSVLSRLTDEMYLELQEKTDSLTLPIKQALEESGKGTLNQVGSMFSLFFGKEKVENKEELCWETFQAYFSHLFERGIYIPPSPYEACFVTLAHTKEQLEKTKDAILSFVL